MLRLVFLLIISGFYTQYLHTNAQTPEIVYFADKGFYPYEYENEKGEPAGFNIELMNEIARIMNVRITCKIEVWADIYDSLLNSDQTYVTDMYFNNERDSLFDFSKPISIVYDQVYKNKKEKDITSFSDLENRKIAVQRGSFTEDYIRSHLPRLILVPVESEMKALKLVNEYKCDAAIVNQILGFLAVDEYDLENVVHAFYPVNPREYCFVVKKGNVETLSLIEKGIEKLKADGTYSVLYNKWLNIEKRETVDYKTILIILLVSGALIALVFFAVISWNWSLKKAVREKTSELTNEINLHKLTADKVAKQSAYISYLFEGSPIGIAILDGTGKVVRINHSFSQMFDYALEDLAGKQLSSFITKDYTPDADEKLLREVLLKNKFHRSEGIGYKKNGEEIDVEMLKFSIVENNEIKRVFCFYLDITERKKMEREIIEAKNKAEKLSQFKSEFLAQMSHEIRTPINVIFGFTSLLEEELVGHDDIDIDEIIDSIKAACRRVIRTIDLILNYSEIQTGLYEYEQKEINLIDEILNPTIKELSPLVNRDKVNLKIENNAEDPVVIGDEFSISQIFMNLVDNAIKYTPQGEIVIGIKNTGKFLNVQVIDSGIGISEDFVESIFEPFRQEQQGYTRDFEGNGLGLALVKKYCDLNNAEISFESEKGVGTTFTVSFPKG